MIFQNFGEMQKGTWYQKAFEECGEIRKIKKFTGEQFDYLHVHWPSFHHWRHWKKKKEKVQVTQRNEMLLLCCTALGFIRKNEYNPK